MILRLSRLLGLTLLGLPLAAQTLATCQDAVHHGRLQDATACYQKLSNSQDPYLRAEGFWGTGRYQEANDNFRAAIAAQPKNPDYRVRWGRLFLDRTQTADASALFQEALDIKENDAGAILGMALALAEGFDSRAVTLAGAALKIDPKLAEAHVLLARMALEDNDEALAVEEAGNALAIDSECLEAMALRATIDWLNDKRETPYLDRIFKVNPVYGEVYATAGRFFVLNRRYTEAIALYRQALALNPALVKAKAALGLNLMRMGQDDEARTLLESCYQAGDKYAAVTNPLRLIDSYKNFKYVRAGNVTLKLNSREADLLEPYFEAEAKRAIATYEKKYQMKLDKPVQVEVYPDHEDFAVRTLGMPGMGALGVTFNTYIAMDSPSGRKPGEFHWDSTMWHELSHVFTLAATKDRIPRWFTEGMAVYEETAASPDWGDRLAPPVILAIKEKKLLPVAELDRGFVHPSFPDQVIVSYFQAGQICDFIVQKWSFQKLLDMMHSFGDLKTTPEVVQQHLGVAPEEFDKQFISWVEARTRTTVDGFENWKKGMAHISALVKEDKHDDVIREAPVVRDMYPDFVESGNLYQALADAYLAKGDKASAIRELDRYSQAGGRSPEALKQLAGLLQEAGRKKDAADVLNRVNWFYLNDEAQHRTLGGLYLDLNDAQDAIREFRAVAALKPLDQASAHYDLARAYRMANQIDQAKDEVMSALESAPNFKPAQKLLLDLNP